MDKPFTILPDAPAMPGAKASPFYVQKEKKGEQKSYRTITHWHDELECLTILDGTLDFQLNESVISLQKGSTLIVLPERSTGTCRSRRIQYSCASWPILRF